MQNFDLKFIKNEVEDIFIRGGIMIEQSKFSIEGMSKSGREGFIFNGCIVVTYIRYSNSPTGWATIREIIQPTTE